jgi:hypothetical protein
MKVSDLDPQEIQYMATLDWNSLMIYLEEKYGVEFREQVKEHIRNSIQKRMDNSQKEWEN